MWRLLLASILILSACKKGGESTIDNEYISFEPAGAGITIQAPTGDVKFNLNSGVSNISLVAACEFKGTIKVEVDGINIAEEICDNRVFSYEIDGSLFTTGEQEVSLTYVGSSSNISTILKVYTDLIVPSLTISAPAVAVASMASNYTLTGTCSEDDSVVSGDIDGINFSSQCLNNTWSAHMDLSLQTEGALNINAIITDFTGNISNTLTSSLVKDTLGATFTIDSVGTITAASTANYNVDGTCSENGQDVNISVGGIPFSTTCLTGAWSFTGLDVSSLTDSTFDLIVNGLDTNGNLGTLSQSYVRDVVIPLITIARPNNPNGPIMNSFNEENYIVQGTCSESGMPINGSVDVRPFSVNCVNGNWISPPINLKFLTDGTYNITVSQSDGAGNPSGNQVVAFIKDTTTPVPLINYVTPIGGQGSTGTLVLNVSAISNGDLIEVFDNSNCTNEITASETTAIGTDENVTINISGAEGTYLYYFVITGGGSTSCLGPVSYIEDRTAPNSVATIELVAPIHASQSNDSSPEFGGTIIASEEGTTVAIYRDALCHLIVGTGSVESGSFTVLGNLPFDGTAVGINNFYYKLTDQAENSSSCIDASLNYDLQGAGLATLPKLAMVGNNSATSVISLADNNTITHYNSAGTLLNTWSNLSTGDLVPSFNVNQGDKIESTQACYAVTAGYGTAPWGSEAYAGTEFSTYISRYGQNHPKFYIASVEGDAFVEIVQEGNTVAYANVAKGAIHEFNADPTNAATRFTVQNKAITIKSSKKITIYFVSRNNTSGQNYTYDARVLTPAATEIIGHAGYITAAFPGTSGNLAAGLGFFEQDGTTGNINFNANGALVQVTSRSGEVRYATIARADKPINLTQIADSNGTNASPSLPLTMLSTNYGIPRHGDYVAFAAPLSGSIMIYDENGAVVPFNGAQDDHPMIRSGGAHANAPYAYRFEPGTSTTDIRAGYTFVCSTPCYAYYDDSGPSADRDETLMMGFTP